MNPKPYTTPSRGRDYSSTDDFKLGESNATADGMTWVLPPHINSWIIFLNIAIVWECDLIVAYSPYDPVNGWGRTPAMIYNLGMHVGGDWGSPTAGGILCVLKQLAAARGFRV